MNEWKIRRRMAILALTAGLLFFPIFYVCFPTLGEIAAPFYTLVTLILTAYYSLATYHDIKISTKT